MVSYAVYEVYYWIKRRKLVWEAKEALINALKKFTENPYGMLHEAEEFQRDLKMR